MNTVILDVVCIAFQFMMVLTVQLKTQLSYITFLIYDINLMNQQAKNTLTNIGFAFNKKISRFSVLNRNKISSID